MSLELFHAVLRGDATMVEIALSNGGDWNVQRYAYWPVARMMRRPDWWGHEFNPAERVEAERSLVREAEENAIHYAGMARTRTPLLLAAELGEEEVALVLAERGANPNVADEDGWTPLHFAVLLGQAELLRYLLDIGADVNAPLQGNQTPLFLAARIGYREGVDRLLKAGADPNIGTPEGLTPLMVAAAFGQVIVNGGPDYSNGWSDDDDNRRPPFKPQYIPIQEMLLEKGADVNAVARGDAINDSGTPLKFAALTGCFTTIQMMLNAGAEVNAYGGALATPFIATACTGKRLAASLLVERGADIHLSGPDGLTALMCASRYGHADFVRWLLSLGARVDAERMDGETALFAAASHGHAEVVRSLLEADATVDVSDDEGCTPLMRAAFVGSPECVEALLEYGADPNARSNDGRTALGWAKSESLVRQLSYRLEEFLNDPLSTLTEMGYEPQSLNQSELESLLQQVFAEMTADGPSVQQARQERDELRRGHVIRLLTAAGGTM